MLIFWRVPLKERIPGINATLLRLGIGNMVAVTKEDCS